MQPSPSTLNGTTLQSLFASLRHDKYRMALVGGVVALGTVITAAVVQPLYKADSTLIVLMGSEYTYRAVAGENVTVTSALDREQALRTEVKILGSQDLHRQVIRDMGITRLYPELLEPPGLLGRATAAIKGALRRLGTRVETADGPEPGPQDLVERALVPFDARLYMAALKEGNAIELAFSHRDPQVAAEVLDRLEAAFLARRRSVYVSQDAGIVGDRVSRLRTELQTADANLARFKASKGISDYQVRRTILLNQQGALETDLTSANNLLAQETARLTRLNDQSRSVPKEIIQSRDADVDQRLAPLRNNIAALRARQTAQRLHYRQDSAMLTDTSEQLAALEAELARQANDHAIGVYRNSANPLFLQIQQDIARSQVELQVAQARSTQDESQLAAVRASLVSLNSDERRLAELELARTLAEDNLRATTKVRDERSVLETVEAQRQANVRVLQKPIVPTKPLPTRKLILIAGAVLSLLAAAGTGLASHFFRRVYLLPEALETETGLRVLSSMPQMRRRARDSLAIRPE